MNKGIILLFVLTFFRQFAIAGDAKIYAKMADAICTCLTTEKQTLEADTLYAACILEKVRPFKKTILKIVRKTVRNALHDDDFSGDNMEIFNEKLDLALQEKCPKQSKKIRDVVHQILNE